ncbi:aldo/keto reductase [Vibrio sp. S4M6]|uniref:aldo/keto reductase n=1 Tax=Vibrio sinus TaxID=2946865 RepID=UPI00202A9A93|nr:aldo/keto reductase [Vibrio sinus]MCL9780208.1 aldo/keto reductase [Vibrio sinus]
MQYRRLGNTDFNVSQYALGTMMMGSMGNNDPAECLQMVHKALHSGINLIDTAPFYSNGESESLLGDALQGMREQVVVSTKFTLNPDRSLPLKEEITQQVNASLKRLRTDYIDIYHLARFDYTTPIAEILHVLNQLVAQGKIRAYGTSMFSSDQIVESQWQSSEIGVPSFVSEQPNYSILSRSIEANVLPVCQRFQVGVIVWSPLEGSWLTGRYLTQEDLAGNNRISFSAKWTGRELDASSPAILAKLNSVQQLNKVAEEAGISLRHMAMAFATAHPAITSAIAGPRTLSQLDDLIECSNLVLSNETLDKIDAIAAPGTNFSGVNLTAVPEGLRSVEMRRREPV